MGRSQHHGITRDDSLYFLHGGRGRIVIDGNEASLLVVSSAFLVGKLGTKSMRQVANPMILNRPDDASVHYNLVRNILDEFGQEVKG